MEVFSWLLLLLDAIIAVVEKSGGLLGEGALPPWLELRTVSQKLFPVLPYYS